MNAYLCTYRRIVPSSVDRRKTIEAAAADPLLRRFLATYDKSYLDWGDDPSFFAAKEILGDVGKASWGVCRRDVRAVLAEGDVVIFFCGSQKDGFWRYYFVGFGTVRRRIEREALWTDTRFAKYRKFYNVLARLECGKLVQHEKFHPVHKDWKHRADAPYIIFDPAASAFNLTAPHHVATWVSGASTPEEWNSHRRTKQIESLIFTERGIHNRRLRTSGTGYGHTKLNILHDGDKVRPGRTLGELTAALRRLV